MGAPEALRSSFTSERGTAASARVCCSAGRKLEEASAAAADDDARHRWSILSMLGVLCGGWIY